MLFRSVTENSTSRDTVFFIDNIPPALGITDAIVPFVGPNASEAPFDRWINAYTDSIGVEVQIPNDESLLLNRRGGVDIQVKNKNRGLLGWVTISNIEIPNEYNLSNPYPNPFNPVTTIEYSLPQASVVTLVIYDLLGRQVAELVNSEKKGGYHKAVWNGDQNASGLYFARMSAGDPMSRSGYSYIHTQKLMLVK